MSDETVTEDGRLAEDYLPAVYFDSSVLIEYWITEGAEVPVSPEMLRREHTYLPVVRELLKSDRRYAGMITVRKTLLFDQIKATAVTSPIALLELIEWNAEAAFKDLAAEAVSTRVIQKESKKKIGDLLRQVIEGRRRERLDERQSLEGAVGVGPDGEVLRRSRGSTGLELLVEETWTDDRFARVHGLRGIVVADLQRFRLRVDETWDVPRLLAYLQVGMADIIHLLVAVHLGCTWFASFDSDFKRCRDHIQDGLGLKLLRTPEEILTTLKSGEGSGAHQGIG